MFPTVGTILILIPRENHLYLQKCSTLSGGFGFRPRHADTLARGLVGATRYSTGLQGFGPLMAYPSMADYGELVSYSCWTCGKVCQSMWGEKCNSCRLEAERHAEIMKVLKSGVGSR
jgi:hypothetical protein